MTHITDSRELPLDAETFQNLSTAEIAQLVRAAGPKVCVFPINGTRRWFMLEHGDQQRKGFGSVFLDISSPRHIELYRLFFDHGIDTLLTPAFGPDLLDRGEKYLETMADALTRITNHPDFVEFYKEYEVRVRIYGDHRKFFASTPYAYLSDQFDHVTAQTANHNRHRLFFGVCAQDATETIAQLSVQYYTQHGHVPEKRTLVELYYGEQLPPVDIFIGFDRFCAFDMPLLATGDEDLYFTVSPSLYLTENQIREILYDHLYARRDAEPHYEEMTPADWELMKKFYKANSGKTQGVGAKQKRGKYWYPTPQVTLPPGF